MSNENLQATRTEDQFDLGELDVAELTVVSMHDAAALPEAGASYTSSSCCYVDAS